MIEVISGGLYTTVQDYPGRVGYWKVGIPPSGPMDSLAFRIGNRLVGNPEYAAGLEITSMGPTLKFNEDVLVALTGAKLEGVLNDAEVPWWSTIYVEKGSELSLNYLEGYGYRTYLAISGGIDVPEYLGSKSTFPFGKFGGVEGRILMEGDVIKINKDLAKLHADKKRLPRCNFIPQYTDVWEVGVMPGPHEAPDFFTKSDVEMFYNTDWQVHYNSNRFGYRLEGPAPQFARKDGGEGGQHPSNLIDYPYAIGSVNFTGNMPVILAVDGPSLGGFVSMATVPTSEFWKIGQASINDIIRFRKFTNEDAVNNRIWQEKMLKSIESI